MFYRASYYLPGVSCDSLLDRAEFEGDFRPIQYCPSSHYNLHSQVRYLSQPFHDAIVDALMFDPFFSEGGILAVERLDSLGQWHPVYLQILGSNLGFAESHGSLVIVYPSHADYLAEVHNGR